MRAVVQRVTQAAVTVDGQTVGEIGTGLMVLLGVTHDDTPEKAKALAAKIWRLRILREEKSAEDLAAGILVVSQFTLYAETKKGRRPTWAAAAPGPLPNRYMPASARNCGLWARLLPRESSGR